MKNKRLIFAGFMVSSLAGCASVVQPEFPKPQLPTSANKQCYTLSSVEREKCRQMEPAARRICLRAELTAVRCEQSKEWIGRISKNWPD